MTALPQQDLDDSHVTPVDGHMEWGLPPLVAGIQVCRVVGQQSYHLGLVTQGGVVDGTVAVFVLHNTCVHIYMYMSHATACMAGVAFIKEEVYFK